jgi:Zn-dependent peptidase ImmA (M78 family)
MLPELTQDEFSHALDSVAAGAIAALDMEGPPVDALALARRLGMSVAWDDTQAGRGRIVRLRGMRAVADQPSIMVRPEERRERLQWTVAHEIGELCAVQVFDRLGVDPREAPSGARESVANQLASRLLLPRDWFRVAAALCDWDLFELKSEFTTASHELIARRMLDFEPLVVITIFDQGRRTFRRGTARRRSGQLVALEREAWQQAHALAQYARRETPQCLVRAWPVHEPNWKREILRTEWHGDDQWQQDL